MKIRHLAVLAALFFPCLSQAEVRSDKAWIRMLPPNVTTTAAYLDITSTEDDRLMSAHAELAQKVEIHSTLQRDGIMSMQQLPHLDLPKGHPVSLQPRGTHLMVIGLTRNLQENEVLPITLSFEKAGAVTVNFTVSKGFSAQEPDSTHEHHHHHEH